MHALGIILVVLIGGSVIVCAASIPFSAQRGQGWRRWLTGLASFLLVVGAAGFFGSALSAVGGLNWLPRSFEWPVGYASGVVSTAEGLHVVPHTSSGRIQVYDANWKFIIGWPVNASGGIFKLLVPGEDRIEVITARGSWQYVFDVRGRLISKSTYEPKTYSDFADLGESIVVPTSPWLWVFSSPFIAWVVLMTGMGVGGIAQKAGQRKTVRSPQDDCG